MATSESMAIRCNAALDRIEAAITALQGNEVESLPRLNRDREMLRVIQLEQIANWLDEIVTVPVPKDASLMFEASMAKQGLPLNAKAKRSS